MKRHKRLTILVSLLCLFCVKENKWRTKMKEKKFSIIAISGMPGAGKSSVSEKLREEIPNLTYFDFGAFFRPITFCLIKSGRMTINDLQQIV